MRDLASSLGLVLESLLICSIAAFDMAWSIALIAVGFSQEMLSMGI